MIRYVPVPIKKGLRNLARSAFGLDVRTAASRAFELRTYEGNYKYASRLLHFERLVHKVEHVDGRIVECGVGPGRAIFAFSLLTQHVARPREIWGFDTFEGMPAPTAEDGEANKGMAGVWKYPRQEVVDLLRHNGLDPAFIQENVTFVPGLLGDTLPDYDGGPIALLHLDVDFYESYKTALECLWPYVAEDGIVAFDEYGQSAWPGATQAIDEFFADRPEQIVKSMVVDLYYVVKQHSIDGR